MDQTALTAALRRLHHTHRILTRSEAEALAEYLGIPRIAVQ